MPDYASAAVGGAVQGAFGLIGQALQYRYNKRLAEQQNQYNLDMWNLQNEYNSPSAQMRRFQDAGLNPNLIYGQGSNGNASSAPQMVTPQAPAIDKQMQEIGKLFNLENLRKIHYDAEAAKENANSIALDNANKRDEREGRESFSSLYSFNPVNGKFEFTAPDADFTADDPYGRDRKRFGAPSTRAFFVNKYGLEYYRYLQNLTTIPFRNAYLQAQKNFLVPQTQMKNFDAKNYKTTYYIDRANKGIPGMMYGVYTGLKDWLGW